MTSKGRPWLNVVAVVMCGAGMLTSSGCGGADSDVRATYGQFRKAMADGKLEDLKKLSTGENRKELDAPNAAAMLQMAKAFLPADEKVTGVKVNGEQATVSLEGTLNMMGQTSKGVGTVNMVREGGSWKVSKLDWKPKK